MTANRVHEVVRLLTITIVFSFVFPAKGWAEGSGSNGRLHEAPAALVEARLNRMVLPDFIDLVQHSDGTVYLPADEIMRAAEAQVEQPSATRLSIRIEVARQSLMVDLAAGQVQINDTLRALQPADAGLLDGRFMVAGPLLEQAFDLQITYNATQQRLLVVSKRPLPVDMRLAREKRWSRFGATEGNARQDALMQPLDYPYGWLDMPQVDFSTALAKNQRGNSTRSYDLLAVGELAGLTQRLFVSGQDLEAPQVARWTAGRADARGAVLGIPGLHQFTLGDVNGFRLPLLGNAQGRGLVFQTAPLLPSFDFDTTAIRGDAPPGWDAELYTGSSLIDIQRIDATGEYRFNGVPLRYGSNDIRVVLYGPRGEVREVVYQQAIGGETLRPGESNLYGSVVESGIAMLRQFNATGSGNGELAPALRWDYGMSRHLTTSMQWARAPYATQIVDANGRNVQRLGEYAGLELRPNLSWLRMAGGFKLQTDGFADDSYPQWTGQGIAASSADRRAWYLNAAVPFKLLTVVGRHENYGRGFSSAQNGVGSQAMTQLTELSTTIPLGLEGAQAGQVMLDLRRQRRRDDSEVMQYGIGYQHRIAATYLGHTFKLERRRESGGDWSLLTGSYRGLASYQNGPLNMRGEMYYGLGQGGGLQRLNLFATWRESERQIFSAGVSYLPGGQKSWSLSWNRWIEAQRWMLSLYTNYASDSGYSVGVRLSFSLGRRPDYGWTMDSRPMAETGRADLFVYEDRNHNRHFDPEVDAPIQDASILLDRRLVDKRTDERGRLLLNQLGTATAPNIEVYRQSLPDPFLVPMDPGYQVWPRPGKLMRVEIPVTEAGELGGTLHLPGGRPAGRIKLQLLSIRGHVQEEVTTLSDGSFQFGLVYPGQWAIRLAESQTISGLGFDTTPVPVSLSDANRYRSDLRLELVVRDKKAKLGDRTTEGVAASGVGSTERGR